MEIKTHTINWFVHFLLLAVAQLCDSLFYTNYHQEAHKFLHSSHKKDTHVRKLHIYNSYINYIYIIQPGRVLWGQFVHPPAECRANVRVSPACPGSHATGFQKSPKMHILQLIQGLTTFSVNSFPFGWNMNSAYKLVMNKFRQEITFLQ